MACSTCRRSRALRPDTVLVSVMYSQQQKSA
jgi:hypothetical protein